MSRCSAFLAGRASCPSFARPRLRPGPAPRSTSAPLWCRAARRAGGLAGTPGGARQHRGIWAWGAGALRAQATRRGSREPPPVRRWPQPVAGQTSPRAPDSPHKCARAARGSSHASLPAPRPARRTAGRCRPRPGTPSRSRPASPRPGQTTASGASSERMSIRHPVIRAASRAFWPSLPIASDSW